MKKIFITFLVFSALLFCSCGDSSSKASYANPKKESSIFKYGVRATTQSDRIETIIILLKFNFSPKTEDQGSICLTVDETECINVLYIYEKNNNDDYYTMSTRELNVLMIYSPKENILIIRNCSKKRVSIYVATEDDRDEAIKLLSSARAE